MIKIFDANDRDFSTAGNIIIEPTKCREFKKKSLNGWYIEVEMPIKYKEYIEKDKLCVIKTKSKLNPQAFRIGDNIQYTNRKISFIANHVMFDAQNYLLVDVRPTNLNGINTLEYLNVRTDNTSPFTMFSNVENINTAYFIRKNLLEAWSTIEERWNGVFDADNWNISFLQSVGHDNGETIIYGKNMQSMEIFEDWSNVVTKLYPVGYDGIMLPEKFIESDIKYEIPYTKTIDFETEIEHEEQTKEALINELRNNATKYIEENKYPKVSYTTISNINNNMEIGDTIQVLHPLVSLKTEVLEYEYNLISEKIISLTFGNFSRDVKAKFDNIKNTINQINQAISKQEAAINNQSDIINTLNKSGYVYIDDNEILILDKLPKEQAKNVWRFGLGGLGFSSNGYEGPFETAMTMDGQVNANFITTGVMSTDRIEGLGETLELIVSNNRTLNDRINQVDISLSGIKNSLTQGGGDNIFYYAKEFWTGNTEEDVANLEEYTDTDIQQNSISGMGYTINKGWSKQKVQVKNDNYVISLKYKKLVDLATGYILLNGTRYDLTEANWAELVIKEKIDTNVVDLEIYSDTNGAFEIFDLMGHVGTEKQIWMQNPNETRTDTVSIGKGIQVNSSAMNTYTRIDADGNRTFNSATGEVVMEATDKGVSAKEVKANAGQIGGIFIQEIDGQTWISSLL